MDGEMAAGNVLVMEVEGSAHFATKTGIFQIELSIVIPCLNEALTIGKRVRQALGELRGAGVAGEVIVADNGSTDGSAEIAATEGARVVAVAARGYGSALMAGIAEARGEYVLMADADESHDLTHIPRFLAELRKGQDFVMGNRFRGGIADGAMPFLHQYLGNPVLTGIGRLFFKSKCGDFHCGFRGFRRESYRRMDMRSTGMEFASEMVVKASLLRMKISEVATTQFPPRRRDADHSRGRYARGQSAQAL
jgi:glycosyltransferase involved in cell wall biosynthesis